MTTPSERTRSLRFAYEFLIETAAAETAPQELRDKAKHILRHYPKPYEIESAALSGRSTALLPPWLEPEI